MLTPMAVKEEKNTLNKSNMPGKQNFVHLQERFQCLEHLQLQILRNFLIPIQTQLNQVSVQNLQVQIIRVH